MPVCPPRSSNLELNSLCVGDAAQQLRHRGRRDPPGWGGGEGALLGARGGGGSRGGNGCARNHQQHAAGSTSHAQARARSQTRPSSTPGLPARERGGRPPGKRPWKPSSLQLSASARGAAPAGDRRWAAASAWSTTHAPAGAGSRTQPSCAPGRPQQQRQTHPARLRRGVAFDLPFVFDSCAWLIVLHSTINHTYGYGYHEVSRARASRTRRQGGRALGGSFTLAPFGAESAWWS